MGILFGLLIFLFVIAFTFGIIALFVWICYTMAKSKGLPKSYMWFGLLGVIGIIVVAVSNPTYSQYPTYPQNGYGQNPYQQPNTYFGNNPYPQQPQMQQAVEPQQSQVEQPVQSQQATLNFCPYCGAKADNYSVTCPQCGNMLR